MKKLKIIFACLGVIIGYGWLWGTPLSLLTPRGLSEFQRVSQTGGTVKTYHPSFRADFMADSSDFWPYGCSSEALFREFFPNEMIVGSGEDGTGVFISSRPVSASWVGLPIPSQTFSFLLGFPVCPEAEKRNLFQVRVGNAAPRFFVWACSLTPPYLPPLAFSGSPRSFWA